MPSYLVISICNEILIFIVNIIYEMVKTYSYIVNEYVY